MQGTPHTPHAGFTLVEMIVSLALFSTVITISVGALLVLIGTNEQLQNEQSVMTNLSFALDSMSREMRTGTYYYCDSRPNSNGNNNIFNHDTGPPFHRNFHDDGLGEDTNDCATGRPTGGSGRFHGVSFVEGGDSITTENSQRILYYHEQGTGQIFRRVGNGTPQSIVSSGIYITEAEFFVTGSTPLSGGGPGNTDQASITIFLEARESDNPTARPYQIQTTITQRTLDI
jgi:prepilin-type N-terminal cleavage/methylation domain-containing protein